LKRGRDHSRHSDRKSQFQAAPTPFSVSAPISNPLPENARKKNTTA
jgi:hypothetical protein